MGASRASVENAMRAVEVAQDFELFEDNVQSVAIFRSAATQWRRNGMDGKPSGLDYSVLPVLFDMAGIAPAQRPQLFEDVRIMELETLLLISEREAASS